MKSLFRQSPIFPLAFLLPLVASVMLFVSCVSLERPFISVAGLILLFLSLMMPGASIGLFGLVFLPIWGGHYPGTDLNAAFEIFYAALISGLGLRWLLDVFRSKTAVNFRWDHPIALFWGLMVLSAMASLTSLPMDEVWTRWHQTQPLVGWSFVHLKETLAIYPFLKVLQLAQGYFIFLLLINYPTTWRWMPRFWLCAVFLGMIVMLLAGLADFYGAIDLRFWRPLDANVNPGNVMQRLQSFYGHSSWVAQYITVAVPSILILLTFEWHRKMMVGLIVATLILGEFVLILAYQRAGWVSYPLTLIVVWFSIYVLKHGHDGASFFTLLRRSLVKISLSVPLTLLVSMALFTAITGDLPHKYLDRFKQISSMGDRALYIPVAMELADQHPILGGGIGSFAYRYIESYLVPSGLHSQEGNPLRIYYNNAHSTYLQVAAGQGYIGLLLYLGFLSSALIVPLRWVWRGFVSKDQKSRLGHHQQVFLLMGLCSSAAFLLYGIVDDLFYIPAPSILLFLFLGIMVAEVPPPNSLSKTFAKRCLAGLLVLVVAHLVWEYGYPGITRQLMTSPSSAGCYEVQSLSDGSKGRSCPSRFRLDVPVYRSGGQSYAALQLVPVGKYGVTERTTITVKSFEGPEIQVQFQNGLPGWMVYPIEHSVSDTISLEFRTNNGFLPVRDPRQLSLDRREMAVTVATPLKSPLDMAKIQARCAGLEPMDQGWSGMACGTGGILEPEFFGESDSMYGLRVEDPKASENNPVWLWLGMDSQNVRLIRFTDHQWHSFTEFGISARLKPSWIEVSRPYAPMIEGHSNDSRLYAFVIGKKRAK